MLREMSSTPPRQSRIRCRLLAAVLAGASLVAAGGTENRYNGGETAGERPPKVVSPPEDFRTVQTDETLFAPILADIAIAFPAEAGVAQRFLGGVVPHLLVFAEGRGGEAAPDHPVAGTMRALAQNHRLGLEFQSAVLSDGTLLFGFIVYERFPTIEFCWETRPYEAVASEDGLWRQPFADLADVERIEMNGERATLVFSDLDGQRVDLLSDRQGHRAFRARGFRIAGTGDWGSYTWLPGTRRISGLPITYQAPGGGLETPHAEMSSLDAMHRKALAHAMAREEIRQELGLSGPLSWTVLPEAAPVIEPVFAWATHAAATGADGCPAPWYRIDPAIPREWQALAPLIAGVSPAAPIPQHWVLERGAAPRLRVMPASAPAEAAQEEAFSQLLRQHLGRDLAILVEGEIVAVVSVSSIRPDSLVLQGLTTPAGERLAAVWGEARTVVPAGNSVAAASASVDVLPDKFQVRLMAEPQDRKLIPVTHYQAPGARKGVVVAVQNDIILDGRSVTGAVLEDRADRLFLKLTLTPEAQETLDGVCFGNMGKQLAILFDGQLLSAPTISEWDHVELAFRGLDETWPDMAHRLVEHLEGLHPGEPGRT